MKPIRSTRFICCMMGCVSLGSWFVPETQAVLNAPSNLVATAVSANQINLSWSDNSSDEAGFKIERSIDGTNFTQVAQVLTNTVAFRNKGIWPGTTYYYRLRAYNGGGDSSFSNVASARTADACSSSVVGWGENTQGETTPPAGLNDAVALAAGAFYSLALKSNGTVIGWGFNIYGEATPPVGLTGVVVIAVGNSQSMALKGDGTVVGWGIDGYGLTPPAGLTGVVAIAGGDYHSIALKSDGTVFGWGDNTYGQTTPPAGLAGVVAISAGSTHSIALKSDGTVVGWGHNALGEATPPAGLTGVVAISAGLWHCLALKSDGTVVGWGDNSYGQRTPPAGLTGVVAIAAGQIHSLALMGDGTVVGWGTGSQKTPPAGLSGVMSIAAHRHSLVLTCAPYAPSSLSATTVSSNQIALAWIDNSITEDGFGIERALDVGGAPGAWTQVVAVASNVVVYTDSGVTWNTGYWYRVQARNSGGNSPYSNQAGANTKPPAAPSVLVATAIATNQINLSWADNSGDEASFLIERALDNAGAPGTWTQVASVNTNVIAYSDVGLAENTKYWYRVRAYNVSGNSPYSNQASATTAPPTAPSVLIATTVSTNQINLSWTDNSNEEVGFLIERAPDNGGVPGMWTQIATVSADVVVYSDTGLAANTRYWYRVRAFNAVGNSSYADQAAAWAGLYNSWISPTRGYWDDYSKWSLFLPPDNTQWAIFVTNANTKTVTIDDVTAGSFPSTMTVSNLTVAAPSGSTNTLLVSGIGTNLPLTVVASLSIGNGGVLAISNSMVRVSGSTNSVLSLGGSIVLENSTLLVSNVAACGQDPGSPGTLTVAGGTGSFSGTLCVGLNTNAIGSVLLTGGELVLTNGPSAFGFYGAGQMIISNNSTLTSDRAVIVGLGAGSQGDVTMDGSSWIAGEHLIVGQYLGATGTVRITGGQLTVTNTSLTLIGGAGSGQQVWSNATITVGALEIGAGSNSLGTLTVAGGTNQVQGGFFVGTGIGATGVVWITDGQIVATNAPVYVGSYGFGMIALSNSTWLGRDMVVGSQTGSLGQVTQAGGTVSLSSKLVLGKWFRSAGEIYMNNGSLNVTNANGTGSLLVGGPTYVLPPATNCFQGCPVPTLSGKGVFTQNGGTVTVDRLLLTNGANSVYNFSAGTLQTKATSVIHVQNFMVYGPTNFEGGNAFVISSTVTNPQTFVVGDGIQLATFHLLGGVHSFVNDLRIRTSAFLTGCGTITGNVLVEGTVLADCGGTLTFNGIVTNNGVIKATGGSVIEGFSTVVNNGVIDVINGNTNFHSTFINNGLVLDAASDADGDGMSNLQESLAGTDPTNSASTFRIIEIAPEDDDILVAWTAMGGKRYVVQTTTNSSGSFSNNFVDLNPAIVVAGTGETEVTVLHLGGVTNVPARFYRVRLVP